MRIARILATGVLIAATGAGAAMAQSDEITASTVLARVGEAEITVGHLIVARQGLPSQFQTLPDEVLFDGLLDQLIEQTLLAQSLVEPLQRQELLMLENERRGLNASLALARIARAAVTEERLQEAYQTAYGNAEPEPEFNASHILVATEEEALEIRGLVEQGGDFAALARERSRDVAAASGGILGWFGLGMMVEPFEAAVVQLEVGEVSPPVRTQFGYHLVRLNDRRMSAAPDLETVRRELTEQIQRAAAMAHLQSLSGASGVERMVEGIPPTVMRRHQLIEE